jgi:hypothetical protein
LQIGKSFETTEVCGFIGTIFEMPIIKKKKRPPTFRKWWFQNKPKKWKNEHQSSRQGNFALERWRYGVGFQYVTRMLNTFMKDAIAGQEVR